MNSISALASQNIPGDYLARWEESQARQAAWKLAHPSPYTAFAGISRPPDYEGIAAELVTWVASNGIAYYPRAKRAQFRHGPSQRLTALEYRHSVILLAYWELPSNESERHPLSHVLGNWEPSTRISGAMRRLEYTRKSTPEILSAIDDFDRDWKERERAWEQSYAIERADQKRREADRELFKMASTMRRSYKTMAYSMTRGA
jgi:hypothetical protein